MPSVPPARHRGTNSVPAVALGASRLWLWLELVIGWLPVLGLYTALIYTQHGPVEFSRAALISLREIVPAAALGLLVSRFAKRVPWPRPFQLRFAAVHVVAAVVYSTLWFLGASVAESVWYGKLVMVGGHRQLIPFVILGVWVYVMVAGVSYASQATERAANAEAAAARSQLAALRAQLHPHFLFNALHTVVQLIPREPARAAHAAEQIAGLLRTTIEQDRELVTLGEEWRFVERYLDIERIRFGDRLDVRTDMSDDALGATLPSFALLTLVENAVCHGASPRIEQTVITVTAAAGGGALQVRVHDTGAGADPAQLSGTAGTGLARLRDRLLALYGNSARLDLASTRDGGFAATLSIPFVALAGMAQ